jgi:hypothetical protein
MYWMHGKAAFSSGLVAALLMQPGQVPPDAVSEFENPSVCLWAVNLTVSVKL